MFVSHGSKKHVKKSKAIDPPKQLVALADEYCMKMLDMTLKLFIAKGVPVVMTIKGIKVVREPDIKRTMSACHLYSGFWQNKGGPGPHPK